MKSGISRIVFVSTVQTFSILFVLFPLLAIGGTVITSNLPANTAIINIDARADGAASYNGDQSLWKQPFDSNGHLLQYTLQPGTYAFRVVDPADAAQLFPALTSAQTNEIYTAWTYNSPWIESYLIFDSAATNDPSLYQIIAGADGPTGYSNATNAYEAALTNGFYDVIRTGPQGRKAPIQYGYIITNAESLIFTVPDYGLYDNAGGVSVLISPLPMPTTFPRLDARPSGTGALMFQWPTNAWGFVLTQTTNLASGTWNEVTNFPTIVNTNYSTAFPMDSRNRFFRLRFP